MDIFYLLILRLCLVLCYVRHSCLCRLLRYLLMKILGRKGWNNIIDLDILNWLPDCSLTDFQFNIEWINVSSAIYHWNKWIEKIGNQCPLWNGVTQSFVWLWWHGWDVCFPRTLKLGFIIFIALFLFFCQARFCLHHSIHCPLCLECSHHKALHSELLFLSQLFQVRVFSDAPACLQSLSITLPFMISVREFTTINDYPVYVCFF